MVFYFKSKSEFNAQSKESFSFFITLLEHCTVPIISGDNQCFKMIRKLKGEKSHLICFFR